MGLARFISKPEYAFRPALFWKRLSLFICVKKPSFIKLLGSKFYFNSKETIGRALLTQGVYDLALTEVLWRLIEPGHKTVDVGANIGYFSLLMAYRTGAYGEVHCFEPHPKLQTKWKENLRKMEQCRFYPLALSREPGEMELYIPKDFAKNEGIASLEKLDDASVLKIQVTSLDEVFKNKKIDLIKIDVEGHEFEVLQGGKRLIKNVDVIIFEDFKNTQSPVIKMLKAEGFEVLRIVKGFWGVKFVSVERGEKLPLYAPPNYIATRNIKNLKQKFKADGWRCLRFL